MFDVEKAVNDWKAGFAGYECMIADNIHELEEHLRESMVQLVRLGLSPEEAFLVAAKRLGGPSVLTEEYRKVNGSHPWQNRMLWMLFGYAGGRAFADFLCGIGSLGASVVAAAGFGGVPAGIASSAVLAVGWVTLLALVVQKARTAEPNSGRARLTLAGGMCLGAMILSGRGLTLVGSLLHARTVSVSVYGKSVAWSSIGGAAVHFGVLAACLAIMIALSRSQSEPATK
jgi:hypothetical protein